MIYGIIEGNDWRSYRMDKYDIEDLIKLDDMSQKHQRKQRNKEAVRNHELKPETNSFEEFFGYYESIENDISRIPPYSDVEECYKTQ